MPYILASASPRRQELLHKITDDFIIQPADVDETIPDDILPEDAAVYLSHIKAEAISNQYPGSIVIGCDTIVLLNDQILGKPHSPEQARKMLQMLSGNRHQVITGTTVTDGSHTISFASETVLSALRSRDFRLSGNGRTVRQSRSIRHSGKRLAADSGHSGRLFHRDGTARCKTLSGFAAI